LYCTLTIWKNNRLVLAAGAAAGPGRRNTAPALGGKLLGLAGTVGEANGRLRQQLALDGPAEAPGEVIDNEALPAPRRNAKKAPA
jgi:hypothetical protein